MITHDFLIENGFLYDDVFKYYSRETKIGIFIFHKPLDKWTLCDIDLHIVFENKERLKEVFEVLTKEKFDDIRQNTFETE